jgi:hypothetical protein
MKLNQNFIETLREVDKQITLLNNCGLTSLLERQETFYNENSFFKNNSYHPYCLELEDVDEGIKLIKKWKPNDKDMLLKYSKKREEIRLGMTDYNPLNFYNSLLEELSRGKKKDEYRKEIWEEVRNLVKPVKDIGEYHRVGLWGFRPEVSNYGLQGVEFHSGCFLKSLKDFMELNIEEVISRLEEENQ